MQVAAVAQVSDARRTLTVMTTPDTAERRLLLVHAHPDDETITTGATMAKYVAEGAHVTLVTCTLGEEGEIIPPELAHLAADRDGGLGEHRIGELTDAMRALGVADFRFLGGPGRYRDSGMIGTPSNERPECFRRADRDEAAGLLADVIREVRPQVLVTYDENGGYGHPDHIQAHRVAVRAMDLAASGGDNPWQVAKLYYTVVPRSMMLAGIAAVRVSGLPFDPPGARELPSFVVDDEAVTTCVDAAAYVESKTAALRSHATQVVVADGFFALSNNMGVPIRGEEHFRLVRGRLGKARDTTGRESDLFA